MHNARLPSWCSAQASMARSPSTCPARSRNGSSRAHWPQRLPRMKAGSMACPICKDSVKQPLKKRAAVLEEYQREIRLVAFDLLLYHLQEKHESI